MMTQTIPDLNGWTTLDYTPLGIEQKSLPWGHETVIVRWTNGTTDTAWFHKDGMGRLSWYLLRDTWFTSMNTDKPIYGMSHWMPLPSDSNHIPDARKMVP